jgi:hypothetical protein
VPRVADRGQRNLPNEAKVNLYGMCGLATTSRNLPNEAKVNLYGMCGLMTTSRNLPNEAKVNLYGVCGLVTTSRNLTNEAKVNVYGMCGLVDASRNLPNEPIAGEPVLKIVVSGDLIDKAPAFGKSPTGGKVRSVRRRGMVES